MKVKKYPMYVYHKEYNEPRRCDNLGQLNELTSQGWTESYVWKEFPKMVNGILCKTPAQEKLLLDHAAKTPKVEVKKTTLSGGGTPVDPEMHKLVPEKPTRASRNKSQVPENFEAAGFKESPEAKDDGMGYEVVNGDDVVIPDLRFATWAEAQATQKELNKNSPGHKARKILVE